MLAGPPLHRMLHGFDYLSCISVYVFSTLELLLMPSVITDRLNFVMILHDTNPSPPSPHLFRTSSWSLLYALPWDSGIKVFSPCTIARYGETYNRESDLRGVLKSLAPSLQVRAGWWKGGFCGRISRSRNTMSYKAWLYDSRSVISMRDLDGLTPGIYPIWDHTHTYDFKGLWSSLDWDGLESALRPPYWCHRLGNGDRRRHPQTTRARPRSCRVPV